MNRSEIEQLLPRVIQQGLGDGTPLAALLDVMVGLRQPSEDILDRLSTYFSPLEAPEEFVLYLARWVDLEWLLAYSPNEYPKTTARGIPSGLTQLRQLVFLAAELSRWRGTVRGLRLFLEVATGVQGFVLDDQVPGELGRRRAYHLVVRVPKQAAPYRALVERIVLVEKPAYVTHELAFEDET